MFKTTHLLLVALSWLIVAGGAVAASPQPNAGLGVPLRRFAFPQMEHRGRLYVSDANAGDVPYFNSLQPYGYRGMLGGPLSAPFGVGVDSSESVYVCNWVANTYTSSVLVYPRGSTVPSEMLFDGDAVAYAVAVGNDGTAYVANLYTFQGSSKHHPGNVAVYPPGSTTPSETLDDAQFGYVTGVAVDAHNDVFVSYDTGLTFAPGTGGTTSGKVAEFAAGSVTPTELFNIPGPRGNSGVNNLALDKAGNIVVLAYYADDILVYPPGSKKPSRSFGREPNGIEQQLAFDATGSLLFVPVLFENKVDVFDYASGRLLTRISDPDTFAAPVGVAVAPRLRLP
jgi:hypothetical protein